MHGHSIKTDIYSVQRIFDNLKLDTPTISRSYKDQTLYAVSSSSVIRVSCDPTQRSDIRLTKFLNETVI